MEILLIVLLATSIQTTLVGAQGCDAYDCGKTSTTECFQDLNGVYQLSPCLYGYTCSTESGNCTFPLDPSPQEAYANVGESCVYSIDCINSECENGVCVGLQSGAVCTENSQCAVGLYCELSGRTGSCKEQIAVNSTGCDSQYACVNNAGCNYTNTNLSVNNCVELYSVPVNTTMGCTEDHDTGNLCESGQCYRPRRSSGVCIPALPLAQNATLPANCTQDSECASTVYEGFNILGTCTCAYSNPASSYCELQPGDAPYLEYTQQFKLWTTSQAIMKCNTAARYSLNCMKNHWDQANYLRMVYLQALVDNYAKVQGNKWCVKSIFTSEYWNAYYNYQNMPPNAANTTISTSMAQELFGL